MGILRLIDERRTLLPFTVPEGDILPYLQRLRFDSRDLAEEVSVTHITGVLGMYRDALAGKDAQGVLHPPKDILGEIIERNFAATEENQKRVESVESVESIRERITMVSLPQIFNPPKIPWSLYELVAESVRQEIAQIPGLEIYADRTTFPFLLGVYSLVSAPFVVILGSIFSTNWLISSVTGLGKKLNTVTGVKLLPEEKEKHDAIDSSDSSFTSLRRTQFPASVHSLEEQLVAVGTSPEDAKKIGQRIYYRDLATTVGTFVATGIIKNQPLAYVETPGVTGDLATDINIAGEEVKIHLVYPRPFGRNVVSFSDGIKLAWKALDDPWRLSYIRRSLDAAVAPLQAVALQLANKQLDAARIRESKQAALLARTEEAERAMWQLEQIARGIAHEVRNPLSVLANNTRALFFDEGQYFERLQEMTTETESIFYQRHRRIIIETGQQFPSKGLKGYAIKEMAKRRFAAYTTAVKQLNEEIHAEGKEEIAPLRGNIFDPLVKGYLLRKKYASYNIICEYFGRIEKWETLSEEERRDCDAHLERLREANVVSQELIRELYTRIGYFSGIANPLRNKTTEPLSLETLIEEGSFLFRREIEKPELIINVEDQATYGNNELIKSTIENILKNARDALSRDTSQDVEAHTVVIYCPQDSPMIYVGNTGPAIPPDREKEIFNLHKRVQKNAESSGISLAIAKNDLHIIGCDLEYYNANQLSKLQEEYPSLEKYPIHVLFGIKLLTAEEYAVQQRQES